MKKEMSMKERVENFHNSEIELKSAIINEIKSEFEKYNSDEVSVFYDEDEEEPDYDDYLCIIPTLIYLNDDLYSYPSEPVCFKRENDNLVVECDTDISLDISATNYQLSVDDLYSLLVLLQHPLTKKANKK